MPGHLSLRGLRIWPACLMLCAGGVQATAWQGALNLPTTLEYDSNPRLEVDREDAVGRLLLAPDYRLEAVEGLDTWSLGLGAQLLRSSDRQVLADREDPRLSLGWERETETGALGLTARYDESSTLGALDETGVENSDGTRKKHGLDGFWRHRLNERDGLSASLGFNEVRYVDTTLDDYQDLALSLSVDHELSARLTPFTRLTASRYRPLADSEQEASTKYQPDAGLRLALTESWDLEVHGGRDWISGGSYEGGWQGGASLNYSGERVLASLGAERSTSSSGEGGFVEVEQLRGTWNYALSDRSSLGLGATWRDSQGDRPNVYQQFDAWLTRELSSFWQARLSMACKQRSEDEAGDARAHVIGLTLIYSHPDL